MTQIQNQTKTYTMTYPATPNYLMDQKLLLHGVNIESNLSVYEKAKAINNSILIQFNITK